jgi:membrane peptidoglycan carboxypeptidase
VLAAENRDYYSEPGISPKGILRAAWTNVRGGGVKQGASTITQQYAKNAYLTQERTFSRKLKEVVIAVKLDRAYSKDEVLEFYLNTVYFGRGAYGIETAAQTYFGKPPRAHAGEGAVLAALLRSPSRTTRSRTRRTPGSAGTTSQGHAGGGLARGRAAGVPEGEAEDTKDELAGPQGYLVQQVQDELEGKGFTEGRIRSAGLRITTTIDRRAQAEAVKAVESVTGKTLPEGVHRALVAVEPGTGRIKAQYAGTDYVAKPFNAATQGTAQAGSSFKPYVLAAALDSRMSLKTKMDGASPQMFGDYEVENYGDESYGEIDLVEATAKSVNTVYVPLGERAGLSHVAEVATRLGHHADMSKDSRLPSFPLGTTAVSRCRRPRRTRRSPPAASTRTATSSRRQGRQGPRALQGRAPDDGGAHVGCRGRHQLRAAAGRRGRHRARGAAARRPTGRRQDGHHDRQHGGLVRRLHPSARHRGRAVLGGPGRAAARHRRRRGGDRRQPAAKTWSRFMAAALEGQPVKQFPKPVYGGVEPSPSAVPSPSASASPSPEPSSSPSSLPLPSASAFVYTYVPPSQEPYQPETQRTRSRSRRSPL